jgi:rubredoxin-NAD+ reductase
MDVAQFVRRLRVHVKPIIVVGSGLAGYTVIRELRKVNHDIPISLVSRNSGDYYSKPMLSNAFTQNKDAIGLVLTTAADMAKQLNVKLHANTDVHDIQRASKQLGTNIGTLAYDRLVLALGADPIHVPLQGDATHDVMSVNDLADYARLRNSLLTVKSVTIMGGGLIGCEFANDLAVSGFSVTVIDRLRSKPRPSGRCQERGRQSRDCL